MVVFPLHIHICIVGLWHRPGCPVAPGGFPQDGAWASMLLIVTEYSPLWLRVMKVTDFTISLLYIYLLYIYLLYSLEVIKVITLFTLSLKNPYFKAFFRVMIFKKRLT